MPINPYQSPKSRSEKPTDEVPSWRYKIFWVVVGALLAVAAGTAIGIGVSILFPPDIEGPLSGS
ncbi:MAG: hypothetical protein N2C14_32925 [Planctomycetales bacterium]